MEKSRVSHALSTQRRGQVEQFPRALDTSPAASNSPGPLEQPWLLTAADFTRRCKSADPQLFTRVHEETAALSAQIAQVEKEIDERVAGLYGLV